MMSPATAAAHHTQHGSNPERLQLDSMSSTLELASRMVSCDMDSKTTQREDSEPCSLRWSDSCITPMPCIPQPQARRSTKSPTPTPTPSVESAFTPLYPSPHLTSHQLESWYSNVASRYAPVMMLHAHELYHPCSIEWYLQNTTLWWGNIKLADYGEVNESLLINTTELMNRRAVGHADPTLPYVPDNYNLRVKPEARSGFENPNDAPIYCKIRDADRYWELVYVFHYAYNGPYNVCGKLVGSHDCDFEHITIRVSKRRGCIISIFLGSHGYLDGIWRDPQTQMEMVDIDRVKLYIAKGSHAVYDRPGTCYWRLCGCANDHTGVICDSIEWRPSRIIVLEHPETNIHNRPIGTRWLNYQGKWCCDGITTISQQSWWFSEPVSSNSCLRRMFFSFLPPLCCLIPEYWCLKYHHHYHLMDEHEEDELQHQSSDIPTRLRNTETTNHVCIKAKPCVHG